ncbi:hypothetical protein M0802_015572 [Mischocyttarus mexicanus]|nr:hypothetical protein M0802_015572 [Mischocyttarus mexicanus]
MRERGERGGGSGRGREVRGRSFGYQYNSWPSLEEGEQDDVVDEEAATAAAAAAAAAAATAGYAEDEEDELVEVEDEGNAVAPGGQRPWPTGAATFQSSSWCRGLAS